MIDALRLGMRLAGGSTSAQRFRAAGVVVASLLGVVLLLLVAGIAQSERLQHPTEFAAGAPGKRLLLAVVVAIAVPVAVLAASVARLSADLRDRRMANLRLLGMTQGSVRLVAATEVGVFSLVGALLGAAAYVPARIPVGALTIAGRSWPAPTLSPPLWCWAMIIVGLPVVVMAVSAAPSRTRMTDALSLARRADTSRPRWWRVIPVLLGIACCIYGVVRADPTHGVGKDVITAFFVGVGALAIGMILVVPVFVRLLADLMLRLSGRPTVRVAARRMQSQPAAVTRVIAGLLIGLFVVVGARAVLTAFESVEQYRSAAGAAAHQQVITFTEPRRHEAEAARKARSVDEVTSVKAVPQLSAACAPDGGCYTAIVASCAQLHELDPGLTGCMPDRPLLLTDYGLLPSTGKMPALYAARLSTSKGHGSVAVRPKTWVKATAQPGSDAVWALEEFGVEVVVPPGTPGVQAITATADRLLVITAPPGRDLATRLQRAGLPEAWGPDFGFYDMVRGLRAMLYAVASVIVGIGLLAFLVTAVDRAAARRAEVVSLQLIGVPRTMLRAGQWLESAVPLAVGCVLATGLGMLAGKTYLCLGDSSLPLPWGPSMTIAAGGVLGAVLVGAFTVIASSPKIAPDLIRRE